MLINTSVYEINSRKQRNFVRERYNLAKCIDRLEVHGDILRNSPIFMCYFVDSIDNLPISHNASGMEANIRVLVT